MKKIIPFIALILLSTPLFSQGGSNYSIFGVGELNHVNGAKYDALGGTSVAFPHTTGINLSNPAMWSENTDTRIQLGYKFNQSLVSNANQDLYQNNGGLDGLLTLFNLDTAMGASISMGFYSYTNVNSLISAPVTVSANGESLSGVTTYQASGGITRVYFGFSIKPIDMLAVGAQIFGNTGLIENRAQSVFNETNSFATYTEARDGLGGTGFRFGLMLEPVSNLRFGAYFEPSSSLSVENNLTFGSGLVDDTTFSSNKDYDLPSNLGLGVSYESGKFIFGLDFNTSDYSSFQYNTYDNVNYSTYNSYSFGIHRIGNNSPNAKGLDSWGYSLGANIKNNYFQVNGVAINEFSGSFGFTIPIRGTAELDAAFTIGQRGTTDNGLIKESFGKLSINISIGDTWFQPFNRSYE
ncbi:MAG: hypothetical protein CVV25_07295 [Ignavibacteriae bacterium HGW-Ignavibacteriae-4]|jgi:hypothetical protein|nr:MAG: hypothetical protein CVV25_07295 [Ignavibacteriae bacterium HGW-Ignavibacteriae-4]